MLLVLPRVRWRGFPKHVDLQFVVFVQVQLMSPRGLVYLTGPLNFFACTPAIVSPTSWGFVYPSPGIHLPTPVDALRIVLSPSWGVFCSTRLSQKIPAPVAPERLRRRAQMSEWSGCMPSRASPALSKAVSNIRWKESGFAPTPSEANAWKAAEAPPQERQSRCPENGCAPTRRGPPSGLQGVGSPAMASALTNIDRAADIDSTASFDPPMRPRCTECVNIILPKVWIFVCF